MARVVPQLHRTGRERMCLFSLVVNYIWRVCTGDVLHDLCDA